MDERIKPLLQTLRGKAIWPPPIWLMRQAGRYLPEYRELRSKARDFITLCTTPELASEITLQPIRRFGFDAAILFSDLPMLPWALGHGLTYREGKGPVMPPLRDAKALAALDRARVPGAVAPIAETVRRVRAGLVAEGFANCTLIGFSGAPFTVACYMVEGHGSHDFAATRLMAHGDPTLFGQLIALLTDATVDYLSAQIDAGAEVVMLFDSWAGLLPPRLFRRYVIEPTTMIVRHIKLKYPAVPVIGFPRLAGAHIGQYAIETRVDAVGMDTGMDAAAVAHIVPPATALQGNLDPMALVAGGDAMRGEAAAILGAMRGRPFVFNLGHGIVPQTPVEHVAALVEQVRAA
jgi:uroporphyrinogen decarboxylase